jgi:hypothetical protein
MKKSWIRKIIGGLSLTTAMFVFQACYGPPQDFGLDMLIKGQVKSKTSGLPIEGIKVSVADSIQYDFTDYEGKFSFYTEITDSLNILFEDIDSTQNGLYVNKDTLISDYEDEIYLDIELEEK